MISIFTAISVVAMASIAGADTITLSVGNLSQYSVSLVSHDLLFLIHASEIY